MQNIEKADIKTVSCNPHTQTPTMSAAETIAITKMLIKNLGFLISALAQRMHFKAPIGKTTLPIDTYQALKKI